MPAAYVDLVFVDAAVIHAELPVVMGIALEALHEERKSQKLNILAKTKDTAVWM